MPRVRIAVVAITSLLLATLLTFPLSRFVVHSRDLFFVAAVIIVSRYGNVAAGLIVSLASVLIFDWFFDRTSHMLDFTAGGALRAVVFGSLSVLVASIEQQRRHVIARLEESNRTLQHAHEHIKTLHGLLPICMYCKRIRSDDEKWIQIEEYVRKNSEAEFSHGVCPTCYRKHYAELYGQASEPTAS
jgi:K+-sensing histidine kinase KdpD